MVLSLKNEIAYHNAQQHLKTVARVIRSTFDERSSWKPVQTGIQLSTASLLSLAETILPSQELFADVTSDSGLPGERLQLHQVEESYTLSSGVQVSHQTRQCQLVSKGWKPWSELRR